MAVIVTMFLSEDSFAASLLIGLVIMTRGFHGKEGWFCTKCRSCYFGDGVLRKSLNNTCSSLSCGLGHITAG